MSTTLDRVAIIDDDDEQARAVGFMLDDAGLTTLIIPGPFQNVQELVAKVKGHAGVAICDHRLTPHGFAQFLGAEAVAQLIGAGVPAILLTQFADQDSDVSIRRWRARIPVVLSRADANAQGLVAAIERTREELSGKCTPDRKSLRTLLRVVAQDTEGGESVFDVFVTQWRPHRGVRLPAALIPEALRSSTRVGSVLMADVNIGAEDPSELFFDNFGPAPDPLPET